METSDLLEAARESFEQQDWRRAYIRFSEVDSETSLETADLEQLATSAYLTGQHADAANSWTRAHHQCREEGEVESAARCAFWLGFVLVNQGQHARGNGWITRARRLTDEHRLDGPVNGLLLLPVGLSRLSNGHYVEASEAFTEAARIGDRFGHQDLLMLGRLGHGQSLIRSGQHEKGVSLLDEAMVAVEAGEVSPITAGIIYCAAIETCHEIFDLRRAEEWTDALSRWCESQPELVPFRGQCLTRRAEILQLKGAWDEAMIEAEKASSILSDPPGESAAGAAFYAKAELHRLTGEFARAENAYRKASEWGREPQPGLALLRLAQGRLDDTATALRRLEEETEERTARSRMLPAYVEGMLAVGDLEAAHSAADELAEIAAEVDAPFLYAVASRARGAVRLEEGNPRSALNALRRAGNLFEQLGAPHESARVRVLIGRACQALGDEDSAAMDFDAARRIFRRLEADPDLSKVERLAGDTGTSDTTHGLTSRELQVLRLLSTGRTNKEIASELFISERTVDRHVSNLFGKLDVSTRAAATAYAYEHELV